jgi:hypothetical protein
LTSRVRALPDPAATAAVEARLDRIEQQLTRLAASGRSGGAPPKPGRKS